MPQCFWKYMKLVFIQATVRFMSSVERSRLEARDGKKWTHFESETSTWLFFEYFGKTRISRMPQSLYFRHHSSAVTFPLVWPHAHQRRTFPGQTDKDLPPVLSRTSDKAGPGFFFVLTSSKAKAAEWMLKLPSANELLTLTLKLMNIVIHSTIHLSYLKVTDYFTEIMCLGLQMKTTQDHSLFSRQIKFQTLLL